MRKRRKTYSLLRHGRVKPKLFDAHRFQALEEEHGGEHRSGGSQFTMSVAAAMDYPVSYWQQG
jgi:hypothetical protein